ncbi:MAG: DUF1064 domain-containing protein [Peptostreptococcaceae bacterium]
MARSRKFASKKVEDKKWGKFDSTAEYNYWLELLDMQEKGLITQLDRQIEFVLVPKFKDSYGNTVRQMVYVSDMTFVKDGKLHIVDVKGSLYNITIESKNKIKMCKYLNQDAVFEIIVKLDGKWYNIEDKIQKKEYTEKVKENKLKKAKKKKK